MSACRSVSGSPSAEGRSRVGCKLGTERPCRKVRRGSERSVRAMATFENKVSGENEPAIFAVSEKYTGIWGESLGGASGVYGRSPSWHGVFGESETNTGVLGQSK